MKRISEDALAHRLISVPSFQVMGKGLQKNVRYRLSGYLVLRQQLLILAVLQLKMI
jgi:hypothetical protein